MTVSTVQPPGPGRGADLLLEHCAALDRLEEARTPAGERLETAVGGELARLLVRALTRGHGGRSPRV